MQFSYPLSNDTWGAEEREAVQRVLDSRQFTMGEQVRLFEEEFAACFGARYAVMSNSGSSANLLAAAALVYSGRLRPGDEVIVPAVSWSTSYFPLAQVGLRLRFADISLETLNLDPGRLEAALTAETKAVFAVNLLGNPNRFDLLLSFCQKHGLLLLEDNCESMGAEFEGKKAGSFGLMGTFSTFFSHHICTMEGGMTITDDETLYEYLLAIRAHGWTRNLPPDSVLCHKAEEDFYESFRFVVPGYNLRPLEIEAAAGREQLKKLGLFVDARRRNARLFHELFAGNSNLILQKESQRGKSSWFGFSIILTGIFQGQRPLFLRLFRENGIEARPVVAGNFTRQDALRYLEHSISTPLDNADYLHENGFFVGNHSVDLTREFELLHKTVLQAEALL